MVHLYYFAENLRLIRDAARQALFSESPTKGVLGNPYSLARIFMRLSLMESEISVSCYMQPGGACYIGG